MRSLIYDWEIIQDFINNLAGEAGEVGEFVLEMITSGIANAIKRMQDVDFDALENDTVKALISRVRE